MRGAGESMPPLWPPVTLTHPTLVARPFRREGWIYEEKYDGWRLVGYKRDGQVWLSARAVCYRRRRGEYAPMKYLVLVLPALFLLTGCATAHLPNASTGRCYSVQHAYIIGWVYWMADGIDGWRCEGLQDGELARVGDKPGVIPDAPPAATK